MMDYNFLGNTLWALSPGNGFAIKDVVINEEDYDSYVAYIDPSKKPSWSEVQGGKDAEQWKIVRWQRDRKLSVCDWTVLPDVPITTEKREEWETYRQELRDVTDQSDPFNITWPTPPE